MTAVFFALAAVAAVVDWYAVHHDHRVPEYVAKPAALAFLIGAAVTLDADDATVQAWFVAALVLSLLGDVLLMIPRNLFVFGLGAFLLGHLAYVAGMWQAGVTMAGLAVGVALVGAALPVLGVRIVRAVRRSDEPELAAPVIVYIAVISLMVVSATGTGVILASVGAVLFYASDATIAWTRFVQDFRWGRVAIMVTYHLAQAGLVLSLTTAG